MVCVMVCARLIDDRSYESQRTMTAFKHVSLGDVRSSGGDSDADDSDEDPGALPGFSSSAAARPRRTSGTAHGLVMKARRVTSDAQQSDDDADDEETSAEIIEADADVLADSGTDLIRQRLRELMGKRSSFDMLEERCSQLVRKTEQLRIAMVAQDRVMALFDAQREIALSLATEHAADSSDTGRHLQDNLERIDDKLIEFHEESRMLEEQRRQVAEEARLTLRDRSAASPQMRTIVRRIQHLESVLARREPAVHEEA
jgi:hypothetical protein